MIAAGFGDTVGKLIARCDWQLSNLVMDECFCVDTDRTLTEVVKECTARAAEIGRREPDAIQLLTEALMLSGVAMTLLSSTRPASGSEHAMSHFWEMKAENLQHGAKLHGAKVGVGSVVTAAFWERVKSRLETVDPDSVVSKEISVPTRDAESVMTRLRPDLGPIADILMEQVWKARMLSADDAAARLDRYRASWSRIREIAGEVPSFGDIATALRDAGGPALPSDLGVPSDELRTAMWSALEVKNRYTVLNMAEELGWLAGIVDEVVQMLEG
jgi:glycerol-1-phosphate dehydrogenase [NAD(P)+]